MQKAFATAILIFIITFAVGCSTQPAQNAPDDTPKAQLPFDQRVENAIRQSLGAGWGLEKIEQTGEMEGWSCGRCFGVRLTLRAPRDYDGDERYAFWVFKPDFGGMSDSDEVFYYNRNEEYLLFAAKNSNGRIPFLPLNLVALALGISELTAEIGLATPDEIEQARRHILSKISAEANAINRDIKNIAITRYNTIINLGSREERTTRTLIDAFKKAYPYKTCIIIRNDGNKQDCLIINTK